MIYRAINGLIRHAIEADLITDDDIFVVRNQLMDILKLTDWNDKEPLTGNIEELLEPLIDYAVKAGIIEDTSVQRDLFDTRVMGVFTPMPREVNATFQRKYSASPSAATEWYYAFSKSLNYVRAERIAKDLKWTYESEYGTLDITINRSKPEKDPRDIAAAKLQKKSAYPQCQLCVENMGFAGHQTHPARQNLRPVKLNINSQDWFMQYSPYGYYNEHCIVFNGQHTPMKIDRAAFRKLFDFVKQFPHYFLGSNADLPIVGGSILSHDHFQGGHYTFAMAKAPIELPVTIPGYDDVEAGIVKWPLSVLRIRHKDENRLIDLATHVLDCWRSYTDEDAFIFACTDGEPHNTITPIARKVGDTYELDLTLRNNITTDEHPLGVYHPHAKLHHIKKENIGLIEVMGLAVLPSRLKQEMALLKDAILTGSNLEKDEMLQKHAEWVAEFLPSYPEINGENIDEILRQEIGKVFVQVLEDAGVYKCTPEGREAFLKFVKTL